MFYFHFSIDSSLQSAYLPPPMNKYTFLSIRPFLFISFFDAVQFFVIVEWNWIPLRIRNAFAFYGIFMRYCTLIFSNNETKFLMFRNHGMDNNDSNMSITHPMVGNKLNGNSCFRFLILYIYTVEATVFVSFITWTSLWKRKENGRATERKADTEGAIRHESTRNDLVYKRWRCI